MYIYLSDVHVESNPSIGLGILEPFPSIGLGILGKSVVYQARLSSTLKLCV